MEAAAEALGVFVHFAGLRLEGVDGLFNGGQVAGGAGICELKPELAADDFCSEAFGHVADFTLVPIQRLAEFAPGLPSARHEDGAEVSKVCIGDAGGVC